MNCSNDDCDIVVAGKVAVSISSVEVSFMYVAGVEIGPKLSSVVLNGYEFQVSGTVQTVDDSVSVLYVSVGAGVCLAVNSSLGNDGVIDVASGAGVVEQSVVWGTFSVIMTSAVVVTSNKSFNSSLLFV